MFTNDNTECSTKISVISQSKFDKWLLTQSSFTKNWALSNNFKAESGKILKIPYEDGRLKEVILGEGADKNLEAISAFSHLRHTRKTPWIKYFVNFVRENIND